MNQNFKEGDIVRIKEECGMLHYNNKHYTLINEKGELIARYKSENDWCVNPDHWELVTPKIYTWDNLDQGAIGLEFVIGDNCECRIREVGLSGKTFLYEYVKDENWGLANVTIEKAKKKNWKIIQPKPPKDELIKKAEALEAEAKGLREEAEKI